MENRGSTTILTNLIGIKPKKNTATQNLNQIQAMTTTTMDTGL